MILDFHSHIIDETESSTLSTLYCEVCDIDCCVNYTDYIGVIIEDGYRVKKISGETRIPSGRYPIKKRRYGRFYDHASNRWDHLYVLELSKIPNYTDVLVHWGNTVKDTSGCPLINTGYNVDQEGNYVGIRSRDKYKELYQYLEKLNHPDEMYYNVHRA